MRNSVESKMQQACMTWLALQHPTVYELTWATPNGGKRDIITASILKKEGVKAGVPDIFVAMPSNGYHGLFIEMKTDVGKLSTEQKKMLKRLEAAGYKTSIIRGINEFIDAIDGYL